MIQKLLALFGFGTKEHQTTTVPILAYIGLFPLAWWGAEIVEALARGLGWLIPALKWSVAFRSIGLLAVLFVGHGLYRALIHGDDNSYGGYLRRFLMR